MRLDKFLAHNGYGTRKDTKTLIKKKLVSVNDNIVSDSGYILNPDNDRVTVDGELIEYVENVYLMMNKPAGYICSHDAVEYPSVLELIDTYRSDLFFVGRLDADTEGLLLITNDGHFSHAIAHGKRNIHKQYLVHLEKPFDKRFISELLEGIPLDDTILKPATVEMIDDNKILLTIAEGKYHQVKRMMHHCENEVIYLKRVKIGSLNLDPSLKLGAYRDLTEEEINLFTA
ncbi:rRNA pseudouridine synthase [Erysipelothrix sp. HDW6C]|uniref:pseudouridine synthase n=1 Tax=Erysipelothrix sp. HDW6C TaxID=2714930 RepID=UPI00140E8151|nr:pseudouridine synthase [Erysipelothrix sp. HDW6C]QIK69409.1 rRNA pseudouridine synthase [Erysipelothrix sp. HDW6C]